MSRGIPPAETVNDGTGLLISWNLPASVFVAGVVLPYYCSLFPLRFVELQPPAGGIVSLWVDGMAARLEDSSRHVVFSFVALQRGSQELMDLDGAVRSPVCDPDPEYPPVPKIE